MHSHSISEKKKVDIGAAAMIFFYYKKANFAKIIKKIISSHSYFPIMELRYVT